MNAVTAGPATGSAHRWPNATPIRPISAPAEDSASSQECLASATRVAEPIRRPMTSLYLATAWLPMMPSAAPAIPAHTCEVCPCSISLRALSRPANAALSQITTAMPIPARSSARSRPYGYRSVAGRRDSRKPRKTTALVDTSDRLWMAAPSRPAEPVTSASTSSASPVTASPAALTPTARFAARRPAASSRAPASANAEAGSRIPVILCIPPGSRPAARHATRVLRRTAKRPRENPLRRRGRSPQITARSAQLGRTPGTGGTAVARRAPMGVSGVRSGSAYPLAQRPEPAHTYNMGTGCRSWWPCRGRAARQATTRKRTLGDRKDDQGAGDPDAGDQATAELTTHYWRAYDERMASVGFRDVARRFPSLVGQAIRLGWSASPIDTAATIGLNLVSGIAGGYALFATTGVLQALFAAGPTPRVS